MKEEWRTIPGFPGYSASNLGRVRSDRLWQTYFRNGKEVRRKMRPRILKMKLQNKYLSAPLGSGRREYVHRIVLFAFVRRPKNGEVCCHLNGNRLDNRLINLKWGSVAENHSHKYLHKTVLLGSKHQNSKLTEADVLEIRSLYQKNMIGFIFLGEIFGVADSTIRRIVLRKTWKHC